MSFDNTVPNLSKEQHSALKLQTPSTIELWLELFFSNCSPAHRHCKFTTSPVHLYKLCAMLLHCPCLQVTLSNYKSVKNQDSSYFRTVSKQQHKAVHMSDSYFMQGYERGQVRVEPNTVGSYWNCVNRKRNLL